MTIFELNIFWFTVSPSYYWLMYAISFLVWYYILSNRWNSPSLKGIPLNEGEQKKDILDDLFLYIFLGVIIWGRLWYVFFYNFSSYISDPLSILKVWEWWMSFHGWVIGVIIAMYLFSRRFWVDFLKLSDQVTLVLPIWLWLGRIWNYLNWELLWYSWYTWFLAVYKDWIWYFPSSLLEAFLEWFVLYFVLYYFYRKRTPPPTGTPLKKGRNYMEKWQIASLFLIFYSLFRLFVEIFFRTPDAHIWYIAWIFTMWELLSLPMLIIWTILYFRFKK